MIPNNQPLREQTIRRMLGKFLGDPTYYEALSDWEKDFIDSIYEQFETKGDLSFKQAEILERLYDKT
jgi:hypothetical protein